MACDITNGRLLSECKEGMAGVKTLFFFKYGGIVPVFEVDGSISDLGTAAGFRFEMGSSLGEVTETLNSTEESGVAYIEQTITLSLLSIKQEDLADLNSLKRGQWHVFAMSYDNTTRAYGLLNGVSSSGGDSTSGVAPADAKVLNMTFLGRENDYAAFTEPPAAPSVPYNPFEDMVGVTITPAYA